MRLPLVISLILHIGIVLAGIIVIPRTAELKVQKTESVPVEVIKLSDITRNKAQAKKKPAEKPKPKKLPPKKAEPKKPEPKPVVKPKPKTKPKPVKKPKPKKEVKKKPQKPVKKKPKFNADQISALLDKTPDQKDTPQNEAKKDLSDLEGLENRVTQDEKDALRAQIERCWSPPQGAANDETGAIVKVRIWLKPDGSLQRDPKVLNSGAGVYFEALADSATRAVRRCQPFQMPLDKYDNWKEIIMNFDPSQMFRN